MSKSLHKGFSSVDLLTAFILVIFMFFSAVELLSFQADRLAQQTSFIETQFLLLSKADSLVKSGLAVQENNFVLSHVLDAEKVESLPENSGAKVLPVESSAGFSGKNCLRRLALLGEKMVFLQVCS